MIKVVFLISFMLNILASSLSAEEIVDARSSEAKRLKSEYHELFRTVPINSDMVIQDFLDNLATYEDTKKRLEAMKLRYVYIGGCSFRDPNE